MAKASRTLAEVLDLVAGQVPLLIELKDQQGEMGDYRCRPAGTGHGRGAAGLHRSGGADVLQSQLGALHWRSGCRILRVASPPAPMTYDGMAGAAQGGLR